VDRRFRLLSEGTVAKLQPDLGSWDSTAYRRKPRGLVRPPVLQRSTALLLRRTQAPM